MKTMTAGLLLFLLFALPLSCAAETRSEVREEDEPGFEYLNKTVRNLREHQRQARQEIAAGNFDAARLHLRQAEEEGAVLEHYEIPITEARRLLSEAGRMYARGSREGARQKLARAADLFQKMAGSDGPSLQRAATDVLTRLQDLNSALEVAPNAVPEKLRDLEHHVNLMALRTDLVLSGAHFLEGERAHGGK